MEIDAERLAKFVDALVATSSEIQKSGILSQVKSVNVAQSDTLGLITAR